MSNIFVKLNILSLKVVLSIGSSCFSLSLIKYDYMINFHIINLSKIGKYNGK